MTADQLELHGDDLGRVDRWIHESQDIVRRVIPQIVEDRVRQRSRVEVAEHACNQLRRETTGLRNELAELHSEARALRRQFVEIGDSASAAVAQVSRALQALEGLHQQRRPQVAADAVRAGSSRRSRAVALAVLGATAALLLVLGLLMLPSPVPVPPAVETKTPPASPPETAAVPPPTERLPVPEPAAPPKAPAPETPPPRLRNELRHFRAVSVSGHEMQVVVDYAYAGDQGTSDIFIHAAALVGEDLRDRVPGTSFPFAPIKVGGGSATISIVKQPDTGASVSTRIKVCMVSIKTRSAFLCQTFPYFKDWDS